ncbi:MAG: hypothetical protein PHS79_00980 [Patescibacteria group bacterium]|nr:hypothetical protein [Patescibacteria group bacterium]
MKMLYGVPVVTAGTIFGVLTELGIAPWPQLEPPMTLEAYKQRDLTPQQRSELKFAPATEVVLLKDHRDRPYAGFRGIGNDWVTTIAFLPNPDAPDDQLVPVVGEWKHGAEVVTLVPPSGVLSRSDHTSLKPFETCAKREFEEETGLELQEIVPLSEFGIPISGRKLATRFYPFLGVVKEPIVPQPSKLDNTEDLKMVLIPLSEWRKLIRAGKVSELCSVAVTYLALEHLGRLHAR